MFWLAAWSRSIDRYMRRATTSTWTERFSRFFFLNGNCKIIDSGRGWRYCGHAKSYIRNCFSLLCCLLANLLLFISLKLSLNTRMRKEWIGFRPTNYSICTMEIGGERMHTPLHHTRQPISKSNFYDFFLLEILCVHLWHSSTWVTIHFMHRKLFLHNGKINAMKT